MQNYLETTGDTEGVELVNGTLRGKCFEESWFFYEHVPVSWSTWDAPQEVSAVGAVGAKQGNKKPFGSAILMHQSYVSGCKVLQ